MDDDFESLQEKPFIKDFLPMWITVGDIFERWNKLNINKLEGPDLIHPRIIYEIRHELTYPLTKLLNKSLETSKIPEIWKCVNILPIDKKVKKMRSAIDH